jgi:hypothetical protein
MMSLSRASPITVGSPATPDLATLVDDEFVDLWYGALDAYQSMVKDDVGLTKHTEQTILGLLGFTTQNNVSNAFSSDEMLGSFKNRLQGPTQALMLNWYSMGLEDDHADTAHGLWSPPSKNNTEEAIDVAGELRKLQEEQKKAGKEREHLREDNQGLHGDNEELGEDIKRERKEKEELKRKLQSIIDLNSPTCGLPELTVESWNETKAFDQFRYEVLYWKIANTTDNFPTWFFRQYAKGMSQVDRICNRKAPFGVGLATLSRQYFQKQELIAIADLAL